jgi:hypothetical protein
VERSGLEVLSTARVGMVRRVRRKRWIILGGGVGGIGGWSWWSGVWVLR